MARRGGDGGLPDFVRMRFSTVLAFTLLTLLCFAYVVCGRAVGVELERAGDTALPVSEWGCLAQFEKEQCATFSASLRARQAETIEDLVGGVCAHGYVALCR